METAQSKRLNIDWKWVGVGYCFFVVFHLLPTHLLLEFSREGIHSDLVRSLWVLIGLFVIGVYIGFRSRGVTLIEPALAVVLYIFTLFLKGGDFIGKPARGRYMAALLITSGIAFFIAMLGAWIGEMLQASKEKKAEQAGS